MGAYLSSPITEKHSSVEENEILAAASCSMQGWRSNQEDAHNAILDYDEDSSLFAVYDGHGGDEVARYCALNLPNFIKKNEAYTKGAINEALSSSFLQFDETLIDRTVVAELKKIAGKPSGYGPMDGDDEDSDPAEAFDLREEAEMSLEDVVAKYGRPEDGEAETGSDSATSVEKGSSSSSSATPAVAKNPALARVAQTQKVISPFLRSKRAPLDAESTEAVKEEIKFDAKEEEDREAEGHSNGGGGRNNVDDEKPVKSEKIEADDKVSSANGKSSLKNGHSCDDEDDKKVSVAAVAAADGKQDDDVHAPLANGDSEKVVSVKGKGKGKGKSSMAKRAPVEADEKKMDDDEDEAAVDISAKKKSPKSGKELYQKILVADSDGDDEDLDDEDDETFGDEHKHDDDDDDDDEEEEEESDEYEEESGDEDEDEEESGDEDGMCAAEMMGGNFNEEPGNDSGCTAVVALIRGTKLFVANAGDSRCIVCRQGQAIDMSEDHKPEDPLEMERIRKAGGQVTSDGRVNGGLNLSRAIGDHAYKTNKSLPLAEQMISPVPDIKTLELNPDLDSFVFLACDGIWNSMSSQEVVDFINARLEGHEATPERLKAICEELFDHCLAPDTLGDGTGCDNMTAVLVKLKPQFGKRPQEAKRKQDDEEDSTSETPSSKKQKLEDDKSETDAAVASLTSTDKPSSCSTDESS